MSANLIEISFDNIEFFKKKRRKNSQKFCEVFESLIKLVAKIHLLVKEIEGFAADYDFDKMSPGNGYRSFVDVYDSAVKHTMTHCVHIKESRDSIFFQKTFYEK